MKTVLKAFGAGFGFVFGAIAGVVAAGAVTAGAHDALGAWIDRRESKGSK